MIQNTGSFDGLFNLHAMGHLPVNLNPPALYPAMPVFVAFVDEVFNKKISIPLQTDPCDARTLLLTARRLFVEYYIRVAPSSHHPLELPHFGGVFRASVSSL